MPKKELYQFEVSVKVRAKSESAAQFKLHRLLQKLGPNTLTDRHAKFQYWNNGRTQ